MSVIPFPVPDKPVKDLIWICHCGCLTHYVYEDGRLECASCKEITTEGNWQVGPKVELPEDLVFEHIREMKEGDTFLFRRFAQEVIKADVVAATLFREDGGQRTVFISYAVAKTEPQRRCWRRRARKMLADLGADWK